MNLNDYQERAAQTAVYPADVGLAYTTLGLAGEAGELSNKVKKVYRDDAGILTTEARWKLADELGDVLWYVAAVASEIGIELQTVSELNLSKLAARKASNSLHGDGDAR
jgi:NTP pyrophosphatase (non-canonical NTP hydrolase)